MLNKIVSNDGSKSKVDETFDSFVRIFNTIRLLKYFARFQCKMCVIVVPATPRTGNMRTVSATPLAAHSYGDVMPGRNRTTDPFSPPIIKPSLLSLS